MFDNFRDRLQTVQHDLSQGWKSIAEKAKAVNKKIVRKTTFITDEIIESGDQCFSCDLEAGSEILNKFQKEWAELHEASRECAVKAQSADQIISEFSKKCSELHTTMSVFQSELALLPEVIKNIETAKADIDAFGGQIEVLDNLFVDLEEVCEQLDLERRKSAQGLKLNMLRHNREDDLDALKEELRSAKERNDVKLQQLERQASIEKQQVYEDAFLEQMNYYIQHGKTEEPISLHHGRSSGSLDDIMLEDDTDLHKELDDFFGSEAEPSRELSGVDKEQTNVILSSEDDELLNQKLASESTESTVQNVGENKKTDTAELALPFRLFKSVYKWHMNFLENFLIRELTFELVITVENLFAYRKMMIMNSLKRSVPSIVIFMLADNMLVEDLHVQTIILSTNMKWKKLGRGEEHCTCNTSIDEIPEMANWLTEIIFMNMLIYHKGILGIIFQVVLWSRH